MDEYQRLVGVQSQSRRKPTWILSNVSSFKINHQLKIKKHQSLLIIFKFNV